LKSKTDIELIRLIKKGELENESLEELIRRHSGIFISVINNICPFKSCVEFLDLKKDKDYYIYRSALKYDEERETKFCTFLGNEARWLALNLITFKNKFKTEMLEADHKVHLKSAEVSRKNIALSAMDGAISLARQDKDPRVKKIFNLRYVVGDNNKVMPWKIIAKKLDLSIQGCINIHNNFIEKIKNKIL
tara:strand:- start:448 stop:1020 length:573 start_codon:yes stop_codon:yes gene_type:complete